MEVNEGSIFTSRESWSRSTDEPIWSSLSSLRAISDDVVDIVSALRGCPSSSINSNSPLSDRLRRRLRTRWKLGVAGQDGWSGEGVVESAGKALWKRGGMRKEEYISENFSIKFKNLRLNRNKFLWHEAFHIYMYLLLLLLHRLQSYFLCVMHRRRCIVT